VVAKASLDVDAKESASEPDLARATIRPLTVQALALPKTWDLLKGSPQAFGPSGEILLQRLESLLLREFADPNPTQPEGLVDRLVECLLAHGLSTRDARNTVGAFIKGGAFSFADQIRADTRLGRIFPDSASDGAHRKAFTGENRLDTAPDGVFYLEHFGAHDSFGCDLNFFQEDLERDGTFVVQPDKTVAPVVQFKLWSGRAISAPRTVSLTGGIEVVSQSDPQKVIFSEALSGVCQVTTKPRVADLFSIPIKIQLSDLHGEEKVSARVWYDVIEHQEGSSAEPSRFHGESHFLLEARHGSGTSRGFEIVGSSDEGPIPVPGLVHPWFISFIRSAIVYSKDTYRNAQITEQQTREIQANLIGASLSKLEMAYTPEHSGPSTVNLPTSGRVVVIFGASWCGPCKALDPLVRDYRDYLTKAGSSDVVFKVSIEDGEGLADLVADPHFNEEFPDGIVSAALKERFAIVAVPYYIIVQDGKIGGHGILDGDVLIRWKANQGAPPQK
jgi:thiol-disulfide isomerase/thioredoxin